MTPTALVLLLAVLICAATLYGCYVAFDRLQLRTADAFHERGAVLSAGLIQRLSPGMLQGFCKELLGHRALNQRLSEAGQMLVDGKGLSRVVDIVRRQLWLTSQMKTYSAC